MDESVIRAMQRWPNVPAVYGWLRLDSRGDWQLDGERIGHRHFREFIGRNYAVDERGCWYFQNGPQRVFIALDETPWIIRHRADGGLETHTGVEVERIDAAYLDEEGALVFETEHGPGLLHDNDLDWALDQIRDADGAPVDADALEQALQQPSGETTRLNWQGASAKALVRLDRAAMSAVLKFVREPEPAE